MNEQPTREPPARPGRRRSETSRQAILAAAIELFGEVGYAGLTIEGIAARSGTGKQTVYRWWPSKADVVLDGLTTKVELTVPIPAEDSYAADLRAFLDASFAIGRKRQVVDVLRALMAEAQVDAAFGERFRERFLKRRREALGEVIDRARKRGDLPAVPSARAVPEIVFGVVWYRLLATGAPLDRRLVDELVALLARP